MVGRTWAQVRSLNHVPVPLVHTLQDYILRSLCARHGFRHQGQISKGDSGSFSELTFPWGRWDNTQVNRRVCNQRERTERFSHAPRGMMLESEQRAVRKLRGEPGKHDQGRGKGRGKGPRTEAGLTRARMCKRPAWPGWRLGGERGGVEVKRGLMLNVEEQRTPLITPSSVRSPSVRWSPDHSPQREVLPPSLSGGGSGWGRGKLPRAAPLAKDTAWAGEQLCPAG